jgi:ATP-binding cassette subfamily B protein
MPRRPAGVGRIEKAHDPRNALRRLVPYLTHFKVALIGVLALVMVYTLLGLAGPALMRLAIDKAIVPGDAGLLLQIAVVMLAAFLFNNLLQATANWVMARISQRALKNLRRDLFSHLQTLSLSFFDSNPPGELMSRLTNDIDAINQAVSQNVVSLIASTITMSGIIVVMFVMNTWLALGTLIVMPVMFWFTQFVARYTRKGFRVLQKQLGNLNSTMEESISGEKVVQAFGRSDSAVETFRKHNQAVFKAGVYANSYAMLLMPLSNVLGNFFVIVLAS